jgi:hypothetical protein
MGVSNERAIWLADQVLLLSRAFRAGSETKSATQPLSLGEHARDVYRRIMIECSVEQRVAYDG